MQAQAGRITVFDGARILDGNGGAPIENGRAGRSGRARHRGRARRQPCTVPAGRRARRPHRQDDHAGDDQRPRAHGLRGLHHAGARAITPPANLLDHLQREAFYGVAAATSVGSSPTEMSLQFQRDQQAGQVSAGGSISLHARHGAAQRRTGSHPARSDQRAARHQRGDARLKRRGRRSPDGGSQNIRHLKMWVDDRGGTYPKLHAGGLHRDRSTKRTRAR